MIPYGKQYIDDEDINAVIKVLKSDYLTQGPVIGEFEKEFAKFVDAKYAVAVSNGTAALHVAALAAGLKKGDAVVSTPMTFAASTNCALYCGASVNFADILPNGLINPDLIEKQINQNTKMMIPVDYSGHTCDWEKIKEIADKKHLNIIQDGCHALGAKYKGSKIGACKYSDMTVFSFHPVKHITTGEGGMITTNSKELYEKLNMFRTHGITKDHEKLQNKDEGPWYMEMHMLGFNYRMTEIQSALGLTQLKKCDKFVSRRREIAKIYDQELSNLKYFDTISEPQDSFSAYHLYPVLIKDKFSNKKKDIFNKLREKGLGVQVHYIPVYFHPYYQQLGFKKGLCPVSEKFYEKEISIPMFPAMNDAQIQEVCSILKNFQL